MPASSNVVEFTITFGSTERGSCGKTCRRACWLNLEAHPAQDESEVSVRTCSRDIDAHLLSIPVIPSEVEESLNCLWKRPGRPSTALRSVQDDDKTKAERIGIEPTSVPGMRNRQRF